MTGTRAFARMAALLAILLLAFGAAGCELFSRDPGLQTVTDVSGGFHFKVPATWQAQSQPGFIAVYAADTLPATETIDTLTLIVLSARFPDDVEVPEPADALGVFVDIRAEDRGWTETEIGETESVTIGGRPAFRKTVAGRDGRGQAFRGEYYIVRAERREAIVMAVAPDTRWPEFSDEVHTILTEQWFWLGPRGAPEPTATVEPETP